MTREHLDSFRSSLLRCLSDPRFLDRFYEAFMTSSPDVAAAFAGTNMERQVAMLNASLYQLANFYETQDDEAYRHLAALGASHGPRGHDIPPHLYERWLDSLLTAVKESDPHFEPSLEASWREVMTTGIDLMKATAESPPPADPPLTGVREQSLQGLANHLERQGQAARRRSEIERDSEAAAFQFGQYRAYLHASEMLRNML